MRSVTALLVVWALLAPGVAGAKEAPPVGDPVLEKRVMTLAEELRCLVCQNQTLADSQAELAVDLRNQIRDQIKRGDTDEDIKKYMVQRYGDFVLYRPPLKSTTMLLWFGPALLVLGGATALVIAIKRRQRLIGDAVSPEDEEHALSLLAEDAEGEKK
jgi:cytochrome c-type biogenesis protein CcmH